MNGDGRLHALVTTDPRDLPAYAGHAWRGMGEYAVGARIPVPPPPHGPRVRVRLMIGPAPCGEREILVEIASRRTRVRLPYGHGVERLNGLDPDQADGLRQYAHSLAARGAVRITARIGRGACDQDERRQHHDSDKKDLTP